MCKKFFIIFMIVLCASNARVFAAPGDLDTTFNPGGILPGTVFTTIAGFSLQNQGQSVAIQADGKIVVAGSVVLGFFNTHVGVARFNTDGSLDTTFNPTGALPGTASTTIDYNTANEGNAVAIQTDGKIVVAGTTRDLLGRVKFAVARFDANGMLDTSFNTGGPQSGTVSTTIDTTNTRNIGYAVAIQADGNIVVAGETTDGMSTIKFGVARFLATGLLDTAGFNSGGAQPGTVSTVIDTSTVSYGQSVAIQSDGNIVVAGTTTTLTGFIQFAVARFLSTGTLDTTFNSGGALSGTVSTPIDGATNDCSGESVAIQADGKIVVAGYVNAADTRFGVARFLASGVSAGSLDASFNPTGTLPGTVSTAIDGGVNDDQGYAVAIQADGKIVVAGYVGLGGFNSNFGVARFNINGSLDATFVATPPGVLPGTVSTPIENGTFNIGQSIAIQSDGKIVVAGYTDAGPGSSNFAVARFTGSFVPPVPPAPPATTNLCALRLIAKYGPRLVE